MSDDASIVQCGLIVPAPLVLDWEPDALDSEIGLMSTRLGERRIARRQMSLGAWLELLPVRKWMATQRQFELILLARAEAPGVHGHLLVRISGALPRELREVMPTKAPFTGLILGVVVRYEADYTEGGVLVGEVVNLLEAVVKGRGETLVDRQLRKWDTPGTNS